MKPNWSDGFENDALQWAQRGLPVFPLQPRSKIPFGGTRGCKDATRDESVIREWWRRWPRANIGAATGFGFFAVDLDGTEAQNWFANSCGRHGDPDPTLTVKTARGWHLFYWAPIDIPNSASMLAPHVDVRGTGGYIVAAPSIHPSGVCYTIESDLPIAEAPRWLTDLAVPDPSPLPALASLPQAPVHPVPSRHDNEFTPRFIVAKIEGLARSLSTCPEGSRNSLCNWAGFSVRQLVASGQADSERVVYVLARAATGAGLSFKEAERAIRSGMGQRHG